MKFIRQIIQAALLVAGTLLIASCQTNGHLPPADFSAPGWTVQQGQAVWKPSKRRPELAGDLLLATNAGGNFYVQFNKTPFPLAEAREENGTWQIVFGGGKFAWSGRNNPPERFVWFQLPRLLENQTPGAHWKFIRHKDASWRLENSRTGESLEGFLSQ